MLPQTKNYCFTDLILVEGYLVTPDAKPSVITKCWWKCALSHVKVYLITP